MFNDTFVSLNSNETFVGVFYVALGLFGIFENGLAAYLIATDPEMRNPTYLFMIHLSFTDIITLLPIAVYAGIGILFPESLHVIPIRIGAFLTAVGWYLGCLFMVLASFSRYVQLAKSHQMSRYFSKRNLIWTIALSWLIPSIMYTWFLYYTPLPFQYFPKKFTWGFNQEEPFGFGLSIFNISINCAFALLINVCNLKSMICVRRVRLQLRMLETSANQKREIKLFAQCAITGTLYTVTVVYFFVVSVLFDSLATFEFLVTHILWIINHLQNPIIYLVLNVRLRHRCLRLFGCKATEYAAPMERDSSKSLCGDSVIKATRL